MLPVKLLPLFSIIDSNQKLYSVLCDQSCSLPYMAHEVLRFIHQNPFIWPFWEKRWIVLSNEHNATASIDKLIHKYMKTNGSKLR